MKWGMEITRGFRSASRDRLWSVPWLSAYGLPLSAFCLRGCLLDGLDQLIRSTGGANCFQIAHTALIRT